MNKKILFVSLFFAAFLERVAFDIGSNFELITATMVIASIYLSRKESATMVFFVLFFSDLILGNSNIFIFTWTGFLLPALLIHKLVKKDGISQKLLSGILAGASSVGFFFLWTNFGVWLTTSMYSKDIFGLLNSYVNAVPFLRNQAMSVLSFVPAGILLTELYFQMIKKIRKKYSINQVYV